MGNKRISDYTNSTSIASTTEFLTEKSDGAYEAADFALLKYSARNLGGVTSRTSGYTITDTDKYDILLLSGASAAATFTLPTLADNQARVLEFVNADTTYNMVIEGEGAETVSGMASFTILPGHTCRIIATASEWKILSSSFEVIPVQGTNYAVYTKTFTGNLDADATTEIAHGVTAAKIVSCTAAAYDDNFNLYWVAEIYAASSLNSSFAVAYGATNIIFGAVGSYVQGNAYTVTIKYYVD